MLVVYLKHCDIRFVNIFPNICSHCLSKTIKNNNKIKIYDMDYPRKTNENEKWKFSIHSIDNFKGTNFRVYRIMEISS